MTSAGASALAAAKRMIDRVHGHATNLRPLAKPSVAARLADGNVLVLDIADLSDRGPALDVDHADTHDARRHQKASGVHS